MTGDPKRPTVIERTHGSLSAQAPSERRIPVSPESRSQVSRSEEDDARSSSRYRAALEALFAPKTGAPKTGAPKTADALAEPVPAEAPRSAKKRVTLPTRDDPRKQERDKRLGKLMAAEGRAAVSKAAEDFARAGFAFPEEQEVMLKLLDHDRDARVHAALACIDRLLDAEPPLRRPVLDARLRRLEDDADEADVRALAAGVRRKLLARHGR